MSLAASFNKYKNELADTAARNAQYARPSTTNAPMRTSATKPAPSSSSGEKRTHDAAFTASPHTAAAAHTVPGGRELMTQVWAAINYLKDKNFQPVAFDNLISYLSLPIDSTNKIPLIKRALQANDRVEYVPKAQSGIGKESFKYRPLHPVTNAEELRNYLVTFQTAQGLSVKELKDGWPDCASDIDRLESEGHILVTRNKKDNTARCIWPDSPTYHIGNSHASATNQQVGRVDSDFVEFWNKTKLPANENDIRNELERNKIVPTSAVNEVKKVEMKKKERKRINRRGGKTTNSHMLGILKEYPGKR